MLNKTNNFRYCYLMSTGTKDGVIELAYFMRNRTSYVREFYKFYKYVHVGNS